MKKTAMIMVVLLTAGMASANVYVGWNAVGGFFWSNPVTGILAGGGSTIAQLIWSPDAAVSDANANTADYLTGGETLLNEWTLTEAGESEWAFWTTDIVVDDGGANPAGGYVYARIFQDSVVETDDYYYAGPVIAAQNLDPNGEPKPQAQDYAMNIGGVSGDEIDGQYSAQVVPEPATLALFGIGALIVGLRRKSR